LQRSCLLIQQLKAASPDESERLNSEMQRLIGADEMGEIYKFFFLGLKKYGKAK
jgi:SAM-dependent MidA family methyltransferase